MELEHAIVSLAPCLMRFCTGMTGSAELGEEIAQEALASLVGWWRRNGEPESARAFAFTVARRIARRTLRRQRLMRPLDVLSERAAPGPDPEEIVGRRGELARTRDAIARLPIRDREALLLVAAGDLSGLDVANLLKISRSALKMRTHRARRQLQRALEKNDESRRETRRRVLRAR